MHVFKDDQAEEWELSLTVGAIKRVHSKHKIDLLKIHEDNAGEQIAGDMLFLTDILYTLLEPAAKSRNVSSEDFSNRLGGKALAAAMAAFWEEINDFFRCLEEGLPKPTKGTASTLGNLSTASPESSESTRIPEP